MYLVRSSYFVKTLYSKAFWRGDHGTKKLYLTFDDGPLPGVTEFVLDVLKEKNVKATFFCVGENVRKHPVLFQRIINEGHVVGNHTQNHVNGWNMHTSVYLENVEECRKILEHSGSGSKLFRPPYGKLKRSQYSILRSQYQIIMWDVLSGDYDKDTSPERCLKNVLDMYRNGSVIVFHDSIKAQKKMEYAMPLFIDHALKNGFEFLPIGSEM
jgi:peptidoglycan/xylan/chitin deacetylase (PgdA/CDA1 family)